MVNSQSIIQSYIEVKEKEIKQDKLRDTQSPQLISVLDKESQHMRIAVIQPPKAEDSSMKKLLNSNSTWASLVWLTKLTSLNKKVS